MTEPKLSLEGPSEIQEAGKTVKLDSKKSRFARQAETKEVFEKKATQVHSKMMNRQEQIFDLGTKFIGIMKDKTLPANKGPIQQSLEKEVLGKLIEFAIDLNNDDPTESGENREGMGSIGLLTLVFRSAMLMRDRYNLIEHKVEQLEKQLKSSPPSSDHDK